MEVLTTLIKLKNKVITNILKGFSRQFYGICVFNILVEFKVRILAETNFTVVLSVYVSKDYFKKRHKRLKTTEEMKLSAINQRFHLFNIDCEKSKYTS